MHESAKGVTLTFLLKVSKPYNLLMNSRPTRRVGSVVDETSLENKVRFDVLILLKL